MTRFCRTCLEIIIEGQSFCNLSVGQLDQQSEQIILQLESLVPQITLNVVRDPVMCIYCVHAAKAAYNFKLKCIETEEKIYNRILETDNLSDSIDISIVAFNDNKNDVLCEVEVFEEKFTPSTESFEECYQNEHEDSQVDIKTEVPELIDPLDINVNNTRKYEDNKQQTLVGDQDHGIRPCSVVLTSVGHLIQESINKSSKLCTLLQKNSKTDNSNEIQTRNKNNSLCNKAVHALGKAESCGSSSSTPLRHPKTPVQHINGSKIKHPCNEVNLQNFKTVPNQVPRSIISQGSCNTPYLNKGCNKKKVSKHKINSLNNADSSKLNNEVKSAKEVNNVVKVYDKQKAVAEKNKDIKRVSKEKRNKKKEFKIQHEKIKNISRLCKEKILEELRNTSTTMCSGNVQSDKTELSNALFNVSTSSKGIAKESKANRKRKKAVIKVKLNGSCYNKRLLPSKKHEKNSELYETSSALEKPVKTETNQDKSAILTGDSGSSSVRKEENEFMKAIGLQRSDEEVKTLRIKLRTERRIQPRNSSPKIKKFKDRSSYKKNKLNGGGSESKKVNNIRTHQENSEDKTKQSGSSFKKTQLNNLIEGKTVEKDSHNSHTESKPTCSSSELKPKEIRGKHGIKTNEFDRLKPVLGKTDNVAVDQETSKRKPKQSNQQPNESVLTHLGEIKTDDKDLCNLQSTSSYKFTPKRPRGRPKIEKADIKEFQSENFGNSSMTLRPKSFPIYRPNDDSTYIFTGNEKLNSSLRGNSCYNKRIGLECEKCGYKTNISTNFEHHMMVHNNDKNYKCANCPYKTHLKVNLQRHRLIHTGQKPYKCKDCEFKSAWKHSLQLHVKITHPTAHAT